MTEKKCAELRKFLSNVTGANVSAFIDLKKLYRSEVFNLTVEMAIEHAAKHHDFTFLDRILTLLDGTAYAGGFIARLRPTLSFIITETRPRKFKKATQEQVAKVMLQEQQRSAEPKQMVIHLSEKVGAIAKPKHQKALDIKTAVAKSGKKIVQSKVSYDLMDSWLMLPGGYGTGRRR